MGWTIRMEDKLCRASEGREKASLLASLPPEKRPSVHCQYIIEVGTEECMRTCTVANNRPFACSICQTIS